jgi:TPR repeat protein
LLHRAAELGSADAYHNLGVIYKEGFESYEGIRKDDIKAKQYLEKGAMGGCVTSRLNLGCMDADTGSFDRAIKHWLIAASGGEINAVNCLKRAMTDGKATRDHYAQALRGYEKYLNDVRSDQRDQQAAAYRDDCKYLYDA